MTKESWETYKKMNEFDYDKFIDGLKEDISELPYYGPVEIEQGVYYIG